MAKIKKALYDLFYINNELSLTRMFLVVLFLIGISGCIGIYMNLILAKIEIIDMIKWILALVIGNKAVDNVVSQVFSSPRGQMPSTKNPRGDIKNV